MAKWGNIELLDNLCEWAKGVINTDKLNNKLLLAEDYEGNIVLHHASRGENVQILERTMKWAKQQLKSEELNKLLSSQDNLRETAWHVAAQRGNVEILDKLCEWAKEVINTEKLNNNPLLARDEEGNTVLHSASLMAIYRYF